MHISCLLAQKLVAVCLGLCIVTVGKCASEQVGWWTFNGVSSSVSGATLESGGATSPEYVSDRLGNPSSALFMDGDDGFIAGNWAGGRRAPFTAMAWIKPGLGSRTPIGPSPGGGGMAILSVWGDQSYWDDDFVFAVRGNGNIVVTIGSNYDAAASLEASPAGYYLNGWVHATATFDGTELRMYFNGQVVGSRTPAPDSRSSYVAHHIIRLGRSVYPEGNFWGTLDDVRLYSYAIAPEVISQLTVHNQPDDVPLLLAGGPPVVHPVQQPPSAAKHLIFIVHGINDGPNVPEADNSPNWMHRMKAALETRILSQNLQLSDFDIQIVDWSEDASKTLRIPGNPPGWGVMHRATLQGRLLGESIAKMSGVESVWFIGHSMGARVIDMATATLKNERSDAVFVAETFLDPYTRVTDSIPPFALLDGQPPWENTFGGRADWAVSYVNSDDYPGTDQSIRQGATIDITNLKSQFGYTANGHGWPVQWMIGILEGRALAANEYGPNGRPMGFIPSLLGTPSPTDLQSLRNDLPKGHRIHLSTETYTIQERMSPRSLVSKSVTHLRPAVDGHSQGGFVEINDHGAILETNSPSWVRFVVTSETPINGMRLRYQLNSLDTSAVGMLSIYVDDVPVATLLQSDAAEAPTRSGWLWFKEEMPAGAHTIAFRIDTLNGARARASVDEVEIGFATYVETEEASAYFAPSVSITDSEVVFSFNSVPGDKYQVERSENLSIWTKRWEVDGTGARVFLEEPRSSDAVFFRLLLP